MFYIIDDISLPQRTAASKARRDIDFFLQPDQELWLYHKEQKGFAQWEIFKNKRRILRKIKENDLFLVYWPLYLRRPCNGSRWLGKIKGAGIALVHDLNSLREQRGKQAVKREIKALNQFQAVIVHNEKMKEWLTEQGLKAPMVVLGIFDYRAEEKEKVRQEEQTRIRPEEKEKAEKGILELVVAGNLSPDKAGYLYQPLQSENFKINAYGTGYVFPEKKSDPKASKKQDSNSVCYQGSFVPELLPRVMKGDFGLVWDGPVTETCLGPTGEYLRYNNPHKVSLYIRSGLPVILWEEAALADFIRERKLGFTIRSLQELEESLKKVTETEYAEYLQNIEALSRELEEGAFTKRAMAEAVKYIKKETNED